MHAMIEFQCWKLRVKRPKLLTNEKALPCYDRRWKLNTNMELTIKLGT